jgi:hypothetical protein
MTAAARPRAGRLPDRPLATTPSRLRGFGLRRDEDRRAARQPGLGLAGLLLVVPVAVLLAAGAGGAEASARVLGPIVTFGLTPLVMVAFWWEDWPGTRLGAWSGWADTLLVAVAAVALTVAGQGVVGHVDLDGIFDATPARGQAPAFPATLPLAGGAFAAMLQLTLVNEGWPLRALPRRVAGVAAVALAWGAALVVYLALVDVRPPAGSGLTGRSGPVAATTLGTVLVLVGAWQTWLFVAWRGWPFAAHRRRAVRIAAGNAVVLGGAVVTYLVAHDAAGVGEARVTAAAGCVIAAGLVVAMLFEGALAATGGAGRERFAVLVAMIALGAALLLGLELLAEGIDQAVVSRDEWVTHAALDALATSVILHVAVGRRWPFDAGTTRPGP